MGDGVLTLPQAARRLRLSVRSLRDRSFRERHGLPVIRVGRRVVGISSEDIAAALARGRESFERNGGGGA